MTASVVSLQNGSRKSVSGCGTTSMSDSLIACQPRRDEPSKPMPSSKVCSSTASAGTVKCFQRPGKSMNRRSTALTSFSRRNASTSRGVIPIAWWERRERGIANIAGNGRFSSPTRKSLQPRQIVRPGGDGGIDPLEDEEPGQDAEHDREQGEQAEDERLAGGDVREVLGRVAGAEVDPLPGPEQVGGGEDGAEDGGNGEAGREVPGADHDEQFADEPAQAGQAHGGEEEDAGEAGVCGHRLGQAAEFVHVAVVGPVVDDADGEEQGTGRDAVGEHLEDRPGGGPLVPGAGVRPRAPRRQAED